MKLVTFITVSTLIFTASLASAGVVKGACPDDKDILSSNASSFVKTVLSGSEKAPVTYKKEKAQKAVK